jgi:hypothetical protein
MERETLHMTKGRKRKFNAKRHPNGKTNTYTDPAKLGKARRVVEQLWRDASNPMFGFPLGILFATEFLTEAEFNAGMEWASLHWRHAQVIGLMLPKCKAINWNGPRGKALSEPPSMSEVKSVRVKKARSDGVAASADPMGIAFLVECCIEDRDPCDRFRLKRVLAALAEWRAGRVRARNRSIKSSAPMMEAQGC